MEDLRAALAGSVSADEGTRVAADAFLKSAAARSGAALGLLGLASDAATEMGTRQSAGRSSGAKRRRVSEGPGGGPYFSTDFFEDVR